MCVYITGSVHSYGNMIQPKHFSSKAECAWSLIYHFSYVLGDCNLQFLIVLTMHMLFLSVYGNIGNDIYYASILQLCESFGWQNNQEMNYFFKIICHIILCVLHCR